MTETNLAALAFRIARELTERTVVQLCDDEQQAQALAAAVEALACYAPVIFLPSSDALPGDVAPASPGNIGRRTAALRKLRGHAAARPDEPIACILSGEAAAQRYADPADYDSAPPVISVGEKIEAEPFATMLAQIGYFADDRVDEPGEVAVRGDVIDIFPADTDHPARLEIVDGRISAIRSYDPVSQRSLEDLDTLEIGRAAEPAPSRHVSILAHIAAGAIGMTPRADGRRRRFIALAQDAAERSGRAPEAIDEALWQVALEGWQSIVWDEAEAPIPRFVEQRAPLAACAKFLAPLREGGRKLLLVGSVRDLRFVRPRLERRLGIDFEPCGGWQDVVALPQGVAASLEMPVDRGFVDDDTIVLAAGDLLGSRAILGSVPEPLSGIAKDGETMRIGDVVVHEDHGVAVIAGLEASPGDQGEEMIVLEHAGGNRRLVALHEASRLWRYGADPEAVTLDRLDGRTWQARRAAIDEAVAESAAALKAMADERHSLIAPVIDPDPATYERFVAGFAFNETADQARAIAAVRDDLASGKPMDRLVIGDVGYGKTEVALRAAALAALAGFQVIVAAPTTVLVRQHVETFERRFKDTGIVVAGLSRLTSATERKRIRSALAEGTISIVIGTGAVMAKSVSYARLGLVVIDEEQRFGAADKARLRGDGSIHLLTLSATPIPRTLQMALVGLQTMSTITTPPARRQPIRTSVDRFDDARVRTALEREKARGGQSFVVVPRIEDMAKLGDRLRRLAPGLEIVEAHGKRPAAEVDAVMVDFAEGIGDVLLATNIIEAGLDIPRANTMIVWRADRFGLAQLHQLRGRVGRGNRRGQVYLLTDDKGEIAERTLKRLRTLAAFDQLGAGFLISAQDLDMRGAGDLVGETQAGHMTLIGVDLYQHLLENALRRTRGESVEEWEPELRIGMAGAFPESWIPEPDMRLGLYGRLSRLTEAAELDGFEDELVDRFGPLPQTAEHLLSRARLAILARSAGVERIDAGPAGIALTLRAGTAPLPDALGLVERDGRWILKERLEEEERGKRVAEVLEHLLA
ncbi:DEAD/DEAH box helicase [Novosphingobium sp. JCM 18896]|uniref:DEAD/DEAH box helicase n=1 Tax=Novosphingobium sp. JCM 18896 TaxID=2989731 RepID=UPI002222FC43|nr:DEAD/DEAH box helicase [Novosphingobium sp. JCM 18896]MCW1430258.1 helicase-related protein [Novosphingobium sp. JCM 18896]